MLNLLLIVVVVRSLDISRVTISRPRSKRPVYCLFCPGPKGPKPRHILSSPYRPEMSPSTCMSLSVELIAMPCVVFGGRSTKGASKQRRDAINGRVTQIRELLPVSEAVRSRLSQLQVMALARSYIAKSNFFSTMNRQYNDVLLMHYTAIATL